MQIKTHELVLKHMGEMQFYSLSILFTESFFTSLDLEIMNIQQP